MRYEIIQEIKNNCSRNQMRDVFFTEEEITDTERWIRAKEPRADAITKEDLPDGVRFTVDNSGMISVYELTAIE